VKVNERKSIDTKDTTKGAHDQMKDVPAAR